MSFRYENYGTADLLINVEGITYEATSAESKFGSAFAQGTRQKCFDIPATKNLWVKFDFYGDYSTATTFRAYDDTDTTDTTGIRYDNSFSEYYVWSDGEQVDTKRGSLSRKMRHTILLHMLSDPVNGIIEFWANGAKIGTFEGNVHNGENFSNFYLQGNTGSLKARITLFSNVIISDEEIGLDEDATIPLAPTNVEIFIDTTRKIIKSKSTLTDTARKTKKVQESLIDTQRNIKQSTTLISDTLKEVSKSQITLADTLRIVKTAGSSDFLIEKISDTSRMIKNFYESASDTERNVTKKNEVISDISTSIIKEVQTFSSTERNIKNIVEVLADTVRKVSNFWRYENYGTADLLTIAGTTVDNLDSSQSKTGSAFYQPSRTKCFDIPAVKELWIKCDIYTTANYGGNDRIRIYSEDSNGINGWCTQVDGYSYQIWHNDTRQDGNDGLAANKKRPFLLHMVSNATNGIIEFFLLNDYGVYTGNVNNGNDFNNVYIQMDGSNILVSNLIISDGEIGLNENVKNFITLFVDPQTDTLRNVVRNETLLNDTSRLLAGEVDEITYSDIFCDVVRNVLLSADTDKTVVRNQDLDFDTCREIIKNLEVYHDTVRAFPITIISTSTDDKLGTLQYVKIDMHEQILTDNLVFVNADCYSQIGDPIYGDCYNYPFKFHVSDTEQQGILQTCYCMSDIDELLYSEANYTLGKNKQSYLSEHMLVIAAQLNKELVFNVENYKLTAGREQKDITYNDLIRDLVGWSARVPHKMINCHLAGDKLFVTQRGEEINLVDISEIPHTEPIIKRNLERVTWGSQPDSVTTVTVKIGGILNTYDSDSPFLPEHLKSQSTRRPQSNNPKANTNHQSSNTYNSDDLIEETEIINTEPPERVVVRYHYTDNYGRPFLDKITEIEYEKRDDMQPSSEKTTYHTPLNQGQRSTTVYEDDGYVGAGVGQSSGDDSPSYWGEKRVIEDWIQRPTEKTVERKIPGNPLIDPSFPLAREDQLIGITNELKWLNRRIRETITTQIFFLDHIITFEDLVRINGIDYYLVANSLDLTENIELRQNLTLVRWY